MPQHQRLTPAEDELAAALGALAPTRPAIDRDRLLYQAGRAAGRRTARLWQGASAVLAACLVVAVVVPAGGPTEPGANIANRPDRSTEVPIAPAGRNDVAPAPGPASPLGGSYAQLRDAVLAHGMEALPPMVESSPAAELTPDDAMIAIATRRRPTGSGLVAIWNYLHRRESP